MIQPSGKVSRTHIGQGLRYYRTPNDARFGGPTHTAEMCPPNSSQRFCIFFGFSNQEMRLCVRRNACEPGVRCMCMDEHILYYVLVYGVVCALVWMGAREAGMACLAPRACHPRCPGGRTWRSRCGRQRIPAGEGGPSGGGMRTPVCLGAPTY